MPPQVIDDLVKAVENELTVNASATTLINGFAARLAAGIAAALAGGATAAQLSVLQTEHDALVAGSTSLSAAVVANTPAAP